MGINKIKKTNGQLQILLEMAKCCGNCKHSIQTTCLLDEEETSPRAVCDDWAFDNTTTEHRKHLRS